MLLITQALGQLTVRHDVAVGVDTLVTRRRAVKAFDPVGDRLLSLELLALAASTLGQRDRGTHRCFKLRLMGCLERRELKSRPLVDLDRVDRLVQLLLKLVSLVVCDAHGHSSVLELCR